MSIEDPNIEELALLSILVRVCRQYMPGEGTYLDHECMSAGEHAVETLTEYGLIIPDGRGGPWTLRADFLWLQDDIDEYNFEAVKTHYLAIPERAPFVPPSGYRSNRPDVQIGFLRLWIPARANSKYGKLPGFGPGPGPNRLDVEVRLQPAGAMATIKGELLTIAEVQAFRDQLARMVERSAGSVHLVAYKKCLELHLKAKAGGEVVGEAIVRNPLFKHEMRSVNNCRIAQLPDAIAGLDRVLGKFPVIA